MNKYTVEFKLINGETITEEWQDEKDLKEFNKKIAQLIFSLPIYTLIENSIATNMFVSHIIRFDIKTASH